jgi:hypothetical protein
VLGGSIPAGWLIIGVLLFALALRFMSALLLRELPMIKYLKNERVTSFKNKSANLSPVTNVMMICSVSLETVWALIVGWSAGAIGPAPLAQQRLRH